jgi:hypothetical protein
MGRVVSRADMSSPQGRAFITVSNGGGAGVVFASGAWRRAKPIAFFVAGIALLLVSAATIPQQAMKPLW